MVQLPRAITILSTFPENGGAILTTSGAALYAMVIHVAHNHVTIWGKVETAWKPQVPGARPCAVPSRAATAWGPQAAEHCGALPTAIGWALLYTVIHHV